MSNNYDIVVLGGGIGGYTAAIRAAQLGKTVAIVERAKLGGTCLHSGCIPSKAMLRSAEVYAQTKNSESFGVVAGQVSLDFTQVLARKTSIIEQLHKGVQFLMKQNKIHVVEGNGRIVGPSIFSPRSGAIAVELPDGEVETLVPEHLIIATGSRPRSLPGLEVDGTYVMTSDEALQMNELPQSIIIIGGGAIGLEWASMLNDFGVEVTIVEFADRIAPLEDEEVSKELARTFKKRKINMMTEAKVIAESVQLTGAGVKLQVDHKGSIAELQADKVLVSVGRQANIEGIGLENTDIKLERGAVKVNANLQTAEQHIYAIGDVIGGVQLAHAASHEGAAAVEHICGMNPELSKAHLIPRCIYTRPETASVGWTEKQALAEGHQVKTSKLAFRANGKALVYGEVDGFVKVIADKETNDILGVHMIGPHVTEMISEAALAQFLNATPWEVGQSIHPHPTLNEAVGEAMQAIQLL